MLNKKTTRQVSVRFKIQSGDPDTRQVSLKMIQAVIEGLRTAYPRNKIGFHDFQIEMQGADGEFQSFTLGPKRRTA